MRITTRSASCLLLSLLLCRDGNTADRRVQDQAVRSPEFAVRRVLSYEQLKQDFASPDKRYAPFMLQFWDTLPSPELAVEVAEAFIGQGFNPGHVYPASKMPGYLCSPQRPCLPNELYLSPAWFQAMDAATAIAKKHGTYLGFNVDNGWPTGLFHAPRILERHPDLKALSLACQKIDLEANTVCDVPACLFAVAARKLDDAASAAGLEPQLRTWIWHEQMPAGRQQVFFRRSFQLFGQSIQKATVKITVDNTYELFVNGKKIGAHQNWQEVRTYDITNELRVSAQNLLAVRAQNTGYEAGLILGMRILFGDGTTVDIDSDAQWRCSEQISNDHWTEPDFDDSDWPWARIIGPVTHPVWDLAFRLHEPVTVHSKSLRLVSEGSPIRWKVPEGKWRVYIFTTYHHHGMDHGILNYLDNHLAPIWIEHALKPYHDYFGDRLGQGPLQGVLLDTEGDYGWHLAWSDHLAVVYRRLKGRDLRLWMPLMFDRDVEGFWARVRWDWLDVVSEVYAHGWFKPISDWFASRGMYCSLQVSEGSLPGEAYSVGDFFRAHRACSLPGNDALFSSALRVNDFKEVDSICELENRRHLCEIMGVAGWTMTPTLLKQCTNAAVAWGTDFFEPHVVYLDRDLTTIPYPPDWYTQNPYFTYLHLWTDFARRASLINASGRLAAEVLLYCPMDSVWALSENGLDGMNSFDAKAHAINKSYYDAIEQLTGARIEFLIADSHYLNQSEVAGTALRLAGRSFRSVVLPPLEIIPTPVAKKLLAFAKGGGTIFVLGSLPQGSTEQGLSDPGMLALMTALRRQPSVIECPKGVKQAIEKDHPHLKSSIVFESGEFAMAARHRRIDGRDFFWLVNNDTKPRFISVLFRGMRGEVSIWDCESGTISVKGAEQNTEGTRASLTFEPYQAYWVVFDPSRQVVALNQTDQPDWNEIIIPGPWNVRIDRSAQPNLPDKFRRYQPEVPIDELSRTPRGLEPWQTWQLDEFTGFVDYEVSFECPKTPRQVELDLGDVRHMAEVWINGQNVGKRLWAPFRYDIASAVRSGVNTIRVRVGNLFCNAVKPLEDRNEVFTGWAYSKATPEQRRSGLLGPVKVRIR